jgi:Fur family zinc uptake transcriptional regulator
MQYHTPPVFAGLAKTLESPYIGRMTHKSAMSAPHSLASHDHDDCEGHGSNLRDRPVKLTPGRKIILDLLCEAAKPMGAYDMIDKVAETTGKRPAPISIYRALDFLLENGLVHRLSSRNTFVVCGHRHGEGEPLVFLICDACGRVSEDSAPELDTCLDHVANATHFTRKSQIIEVSGVCARCAAASI